MSDLNKKQDELKSRLKNLIVEEELDGLKVEANGTRVLTNIEILDESLLEDKEKLEDLLLVVMNKLNDKITETERLESQSLISNIFPGGLNNLFNN